jgi:hypothetical protein
MTPFQQRVYTHNSAIGLANEFEVILLTDATIPSYVEVPSYEGWDEVAKKKISLQSDSTVLPYHILHRWGGFFFPLDTLLMKSLTNTWSKFLASGYSIHVKSTDKENILCMLPNTTVSTFCISCIDSMMRAHPVFKIIKWGFLHAYTLQMVQDTYPSKILRTVFLSNSLRRLESEEWSKDNDRQGCVYVKVSTTMNA